MLGEKLFSKYSVNKKSLVFYDFKIITSSVVTLNAAKQWMQRAYNSRGNKPSFQYRGLTTLYINYSAPLACLKRQLKGADLWMRQKKRGPILQQMWHDKNPCRYWTVSAEQTWERPINFAVLHRYWWRHRRTWTYSSGRLTLIQSIRHSCKAHVTRSCMT